MKNMETECPIADCDYSGNAASVEAHISGSKSGGHVGEVGQNYHDEIHNENNSAEITDNELPDIVDQSDQTDQTETSASESSVSPAKALIGATLVFALVTVVFPSGVSTADNQSGSSENNSDSSTAEDTTGGLIQ
jgi:hypothetical protein